MSRSDFVIARERPKDADAVARLSGRTFGPGRFVRSAYRVREGVSQAGAPPDLKLCAWKGDVLAGSIGFSEVAIGGVAGALLLGPLAIDPDYVGQGCGRGLIEEGLKLAAAAKYRFVVLIGDLAFYERFGFTVAPPGQITFPGPADPGRILVKELVQGALDDYRGVMGP